MSKPSAASITRDLTAMIERGRWLPGDRLPTEAELTTRHQVSRPTVRKALTNLAAAGLVESSQGKGWFVRPDRRRKFPLDSINNGRFTARDDVWHAWVTSFNQAASHRLVVKLEEPPKDVAQLLELDNGTDGLAVGRRRIRYVDGEPWMISTGWWPLWIAAGTPIAVEGEGDAVDMRDPSPLKFTAQQGHPALHEQNQIASRLPLAHEVEELRMNPMTPVITMNTISWTHDRRPLRCTADVLPSDRFILTAGRDPE